MYKFYMPNVSLMGPGCADSLPAEIKARGFKKALIVCGKRSAKSAELKEILDNLDANGIEYVLYPGSVPNPTVTSVMEGVEVLKAENCDFSTPISVVNTKEYPQIFGAVLSLGVKVLF